MLRTASTIASSGCEARKISSWEGAICMLRIEHTAVTVARAKFCVFSYMTCVKVAEKLTSGHLRRAVFLTDAHGPAVELAMV